MTYPTEMLWRENPSLDADDIAVLSRQLAEPKWMKQERLAALEVFRSLPMPTMAQEDWRRSSLIRLEESLSVGRKAAQIRKQHARAKFPESKKLVDGAPAGELLIENGIVRHARLGKKLHSVGVIFRQQADLEVRKSQTDEPWSRRGISAAMGKFEALGMAISKANAVLYVPKGVEAEGPFHSVIRLAGGGVQAGRMLVVVDEGASLSLLHEHFTEVSHSNELCIELIDVFVGLGGSLKFSHIQHDKGCPWGYARVRAVVDAGGELDWTFANIGDATRRNVLDLELSGAGAIGHMKGFSCLSDGQHAECVSLQKHSAPRTQSDFLLKGAVLDSARSVWRGMVRMEQTAIGADGYQINRNLMLSEDARAETLPGLEILADDIRCSHGATVGTLDSNEVFYLLSRGIPMDEARRELALGFFEPVIGHFPWDGLRRNLRLAVSKKMKKLKHWDDGKPSAQPKEATGTSR
jgi:Fe-S cluster assembly protein SufD